MTVEIGYPEPEETTARLTQMVEERLASRIADRDATLWGEEAQETAAQRLGWSDLHTRAAGLIEQVGALRTELAEAGLDRILLAGMGGSALGAGVIAAAHDAPLTVLDTSDPHSIAALSEDEDLSRAALVVATKSGTTIETISVASAFAQALVARGIDPRPRLVAVTDPDTPLALQAVEEGWRRVFLADPRVGGRFSALSAFGLVPAGLAGADIQQVVDQAADVAADIRADDEDNPALQLGALLVAAHARDVRTLALAATDPQLALLPAWLEQLIAESTGKDGLGFLPVTCESVSAHGFRDAHAATAHVFAGPAHGDHQPISGIAASVDAPLGAQFLLWETAVALVGAQIGIDPFDQPDVEAAKERTRALLDAAQPAPAEDLAAVEDAEDADLVELVAALLPSADDEDQYLAVQAFLSPEQDGALAAIRELLARKSGGTVAFAWGPQYLHSTGQFHKGGRPAGAFLYLVADPAASPALEIPEAGFSFAQMQLAQAQGDGAVLREQGRPVQTLLLRDRAADIARLLELLEGLPDAPARLPEPAPESEPESDSAPEPEPESDPVPESEPEQELESAEPPAQEEPPTVAADDDDQEEPSSTAVDDGAAGEGGDSESVESETDDSESVESASGESETDERRS